MSNQVIGLCPKCCDPTSSYFLQSIFTNGLFEMIAEGRPFKRESLFCLPCITAAKTNLLILQGKLKPASPTDGEHMLYYGTAQGDIISAGDISTDVNCLETPIQSPQQQYEYGLQQPVPQQPDPQQLNDQLMMDVPLFLQQIRTEMERKNFEGDWNVQPPQQD